MLQRAVWYYKWWAYKQQVARRLASWDQKGGGIHAPEQIKQYELLSRPSFNPAPPENPIFQDAHYQAMIPARNAAPQREYAYHVKQPCFIEPEFGYVIMEPSVLIPESLAWSYWARIPEKLHYFSGVPSLADYEAARGGSKQVRKEQKVISLRHVFDDNYGHCLIHLMSSLMLLEESGVSPEIPIVVSSKLGRMPFFQEMITRGSLKQRRWIVQGKEYIHAQEVIFGMTEWPSQSLLASFLDRIDVPQVQSAGRKRLFILRRSRQLRSMEVLAPILDASGFECIRPEEYTFAQQIALFSDAEIVCGVLGAALTNVIFRRGLKTLILEIQASNERDMFFYDLAKTCRYSHRHLVGSRYETADRCSNFSVEPEQFREFIQSGIASV